jgi:putative methyltransferase (TIGR04325 family)
MNIWQGIYKNFDESKRRGPGFSSDIWLKKSAGKVKVASKFITYRESLLPIISAMLYAKKGAIKIIDFGGNFGLEFLKVIYGMGIESKKIKYYVVDNKDICLKASKIFKKDKRISFYDKLPKNIENLDIIHLGSSLHYIEDWKKLLLELANLKPTYILFTDLLAGEIPTYSSVQNYYDSKMPVWFFNVKEIIRELDKCDYKLIFKSRFGASFLEKEQDIPQENFPKKFRIKNSCNLLFMKK